MSTATNKQTARLDQFFTGAEARHDRWRSLLSAARGWDAAVSQQRQGADKQRSALAAGFGELRQWEDFFAYPGPTLLGTIEQRITQGDATGTARLVQAISAALLTHSYRTNAADWEGEDIVPGSMGDRLPLTGDRTAPHRPYFEMLIATIAPRATWAGFQEELRKLRRSQDKFVYETVFVGNYEDAILATILNGDLEAAII